MQDKYMQLDLQLPSRRIYGLGERTRQFTLGEGTWTMWANGANPVVDDGQGAKQSYGVHPFVLVQTEKKGEFVGLYFRNSNAMSPVIRYTDEGKSSLSYISTGGEIEMYFFFKGGAKDIIGQYQRLIGTPSLPPFWSLGWHAGAHGYTNQSDVQYNINKYAAAGIPLEGVWLDFPYRDALNDF